MPIFSYKCAQCDHCFDVLTGVSQDTPSKKCPQCGSVAIQKLLTGFNVGSSTCQYNAGHPESPCSQKTGCSSCPNY